MKIIIPIKKILTEEIAIEEFQFIRNNLIASTIGGIGLGGLVTHDYHSNGYNSIGKYIGDKVDTVKNTTASALDAAKNAIHGATSPSTSTNNHSGFSKAVPGTIKDSGHIDTSIHSSSNTEI